MASIPTASQLISWLGLGQSMWSVALACVILSLVTILLPVLAGLALFGLERLQVKLIGIVNRDLAYAFVNFLTFPGTIVHESSHLLLAIITGAEVTEVCMLENEGGRLGHISYRARGPFPIRMLQHTFISVAPTIVGFVSGYFLLQYILKSPHTWWGYAGLWYLLVSLVDHSTMSDEDLKGYFKGVWILIIPLSVIFWFFRN